MKSKRHAKILELIEAKELETQDINIQPSTRTKASRKNDFISFLQEQFFLSRRPIIL